MVATGDAVVADLEDVSHSNEVAFEFAVVVNDNEATEADLKKDVLHEQVCKSGGVRFSNSFTHNKASKVTHSGEQMHVQAFELDIEVRDASGFPKIGVNDVERGANGPSKVEFTVAAGGFVSSEAMGTRAAELVDVAGHTGPEEALADAMECLGAAEMSGGGGGVVSIKEGLTESGRDHNERNGVGRG